MSFKEHELYKKITIPEEKLFDLVIGEVQSGKTNVIISHCYKAIQKGKKAIIITRNFKVDQMISWSLPEHLLDYLYWERIFINENSKI